MTIMQQWLINFGTFHPYLIYFVILFTTIIEGPILSMILGLLLRLGYFSFLPIYLCIMFGDLIGDVLWYHVGYFYGDSITKKIVKYFDITEDKIKKAKDLFSTHSNKILFLSKLTSGFGLAVVTLFTGGYVRVPFWKFMSINFIGQFVWSGMLLFVGYMFGTIITQIHSIVGKIFFGISFALIFALVVMLRNNAKKKIIL